MARKEVVELMDDLDQGPASQTIHFSVEGVEYEIDLSEKNAKKFTAVLQPYVDSGRRVGGRKRGGPRHAGSGTGIDPKAVRQWANEQGIEISSRGRIPGEIVDRYIIFVGG
ncbi:MAG TPA: Lsr2 family protein [Frankiaceae bacterium]|nr:Lsr2 family protein [Frankiaceae bacterium]